MAPAAWTEVLGVLVTGPVTSRLPLGPCSPALPLPSGIAAEAGSQAVDGDPWPPPHAGDFHSDLMMCTNHGKEGLSTVTCPTWEPVSIQVSGQRQEPDATGHLQQELGSPAPKMPVIHFMAEPQQIAT